VPPVTARCAEEKRTREPFDPRDESERIRAEAVTDAEERCAGCARGEMAERRGGVEGGPVAHARAKGAQRPAARISDSAVVEAEHGEAAIGEVVGEAPVVVAARACRAMDQHRAAVRFARRMERRREPVAVARLDLEGFGHLVRTSAPDAAGLRRRSRRR
jgi:hypothetical protein